MPFNTLTNKLISFIPINAWLLKFQLIFTLSVCLSISGFTQTETIDSLKKVLPLLKDSARIDCLTSIEDYYLYLFLDGSRRHKTSELLKYVDSIYDESKKLNYQHGLAEAYMGYADIADFINNDYSKVEQMAREALKCFAKTDNKKNISIAHLQLGGVLNFEGKNYDEALINLKSSLDLAKKEGNWNLMVSNLECMTDIYWERGDYDSLLAAQGEMIQKERAANIDKIHGYTTQELWVMGLMYMLLEDYNTALFYWRPLFSEGGKGFLDTWNRTQYAQLLTYAKQYDSALYYYNQFDSAKADLYNLHIFLVSKGEYYLILKQYNKALSYPLKAVGYYQQSNELRQLKRTLLDIGKTYAALNKNDSAISYVRKGLIMALQTQSKPSMRDAYETLFSVYEKLHKEDSAFYYYRNYINMKEAVMTEQTRGKIAAYDYGHRIESLNNEKLIADQQVKLQQQQIEHTSLQKKVLIATIIFILLIAAFIFRNVILKRRTERQQLEHTIEIQKLESDKKQTELKQQKTELELQALRK